jgi:hypothetical protein
MRNTPTASQPTPDPETSLEDDRYSNDNDTNAGGYSYKDDVDSQCPNVCQLCYKSSIQY